ncbi:MAG: Hfq-like protein [Thermoanaerobaculia bacterium]
MPMTRPYEVDGNSTNGRRPFRNVTDFKRAKGHGNGNGNGRSQQQPPQRATPPESTNAENFYYLKQMNSKTPMVIVMTDGEEIRGWIEWYDRACIKVNRDAAPNLLIQKHCIKYLFKQEEE